MNTCQQQSARRAYPKGPEHHSYKHERWTEVDTGYETPCWIWKLGRDHNGYGLVWDGRVTRLAHRFAYEREYGPIPRGLTLDHLCRERSCVRPDHLEPVSQAENCRRGSRTKLTFAQVDEIRRSSGTQRVLARRYGISASQVSRIKSRKSWNTTRLFLSSMKRCLDS